jgi:hypothetical protein
LRGKDYCRGCNSHKLFRALDLGFSPLANRLISPENMESAEPWYPLILRICLDCSLGQLGEFNTDTEIFRDYPYLSSTSSTWLESNKLFASSMIEMMNLEKNDLVIEIASNDGYLLQYFQDQGIAVLGIEPALNVATIASIKGIPTSPEFFTEHLAKNISKNILETKLIVAKNVVAHVPDIRDFIKGISVISNSNTLIVFEAPTILNILQKTQFDTIYHEHFSYLSASFFEKILPDFNLKIIGIEKVETHGGSLRFFITQSNSDVQISKHLIEMLDIVLTEERVAKITEPTNWKELSGVVEKQLEDFRNWVVNSKSKIIGYGAAAKAVTLLSAAQVPRSSIAFCIDNSAGKINLLIPGHQIPIISEADFLDKHQDEEFVFLIFPWNLKKEISERIRSLTSNCRVFVALPNIEEV